MKKPPAPTDLWEQMDAVRDEVYRDRPANSFSLQDYIDRYGVSEHVAPRQLRKLIKAGKVVRLFTNCYQVVSV